MFLFKGGEKQNKRGLFFLSLRDVLKSHNIQFISLYVIIQLSINIPKSNERTDRTGMRYV